MLEVALLLLTINDAGRIRMSLTYADDMPACIEQAAQVQGMLAGLGYSVLGARCGTTDLKLKPFHHGASVEEESHHYRVQLMGETLEDGYRLSAAPETGCRAPAREQAYCVVSSQALAD